MPPKTKQSETVAGASSQKASKSTVDSTPPLDQFTYFPRLPVELQLRIWEYVLPRPQIVEVKLDLDTWIWFTTTAVPSIFHVNKAARAHALRRFDRCFFHNAPPKDSDKWHEHECNCESDCEGDCESDCDVCERFGNISNLEGRDVQFYIDYAYDTLYVNIPRSGSDGPPELVEKFLARCKMTSRLNNPTLSLAFNESSFYAHHLLAVFEPRELLFVVGKSDEICPLPETVPEDEKARYRKSISLLELPATPTQVVSTIHQARWNKNRYPIHLWWRLEEELEEAEEFWTMDWSKLRFAVVKIAREWKKM